MRRALALAVILASCGNPDTPRPAELTCRTLGRCGSTPDSVQICTTFVPSAASCSGAFVEVGEQRTDCDGCNCLPLIEAAETTCGDIRLETTGTTPFVGVWSVDSRWTVKCANQSDRLLTIPFQELEISAGAESDTLSVENAIWLADGYPAAVCNWGLHIDDLEHGDLAGASQDCTIPFDANTTLHLTGYTVDALYDPVTGGAKLQIHETGTATTPAGTCAVNIVETAAMPVGL